MNDPPPARLVSHAATLAFGLALVPLKLIYTFLPALNLLDIVVFGLVGRSVGQRWPGVWLANALILCAPSVVLSTLFLRNIGMEGVRSGIGVGWAISILLIPLSAVVGAYLGKKSLHRASQA